ncbi:hypothetical protein [Parendozoicomonas sp. Alg238-R29]|uniref:hypothetical protein n=1 Tax=Parendozoicomonas sp. Alg238-R29 TaxID=2993446 RepID=UPI00248E33DF|nr:hypothetical protein [Parendozoicomonas sp. Alg238-R29]
MADEDGEAVSRNNKEVTLETLSNALTDILSKATISDESDIENLIDKLIICTSGFQNDLLSLYPDASERARVLSDHLTSWHSHHIFHLGEMFTPELAAILNTRLEENFTAVTNSMIETKCSHSVNEKAVPLASRSRLPATNSTPRQTQPHPATNSTQKFYIERQQSLQCGRHAINAYYQKGILPYWYDFENMDPVGILNNMRNIETQRGLSSHLSLYQFNLMESQQDEPLSTPFVQRKETPKNFDNANCKRLILSMENHHVCFLRGHDNEWYLLDSQNHQHAQKMKPSEYIANRRKNYSDAEYLAATSRGTVNVICDNGAGFLTGWKILL